MMKHVFTIMMAGLVFASPALAQDPAPEAAPAANPETVTLIELPVVDAPVAEGAPENTLLSAMEKDINDRLNYLKPQVDIDQMPSLFFNVWEHDLIVDARRGLTTGLSDEGVAAAGDRDISLGGIVYVSGSDWTVWINNTRVTPKAIPAQIMDLKVYKEHIDLEWFDSTTNQIFPIRLRAHQRFNLDTRIFLPG